MRTCHADRICIAERVAVYDNWILISKGAQRVVALKNGKGLECKPSTPAIGVTELTETTKNIRPGQPEDAKDVVKMLAAAAEETECKVSNVKTAAGGKLTFALTCKDRGEDRPRCDRVEGERQANWRVCEVVASSVTRPSTASVHQS